MPLFLTKTIDQLQQEYFQSLINAGTGLRFDITQGSVINALARGSAAVALNQYREIHRLAASMTLADAKGEDLDIYADYGVSRRLAAKSLGTVLALSTENPIQINPGAILIDPNTSLQFEVVNATAIDVSYLETPLLVRSLLPTPLANLPAGTRLYSQRFTDASFVVGLNRRTDGTYAGALTGGADIESDEEYRGRISNWLTSHTTASQSSVVDRLLSFPGVRRAFTITNVGGVLEIWVDSLSVIYNESQKAEIANYVKDYVADGIVVTVSQVDRVPIDLLLEVVPSVDTNTSSLSYLSNRIREVIQGYLQTLELGQDLSRARLYSVVKPLVNAVSIKTPGRDVFIKRDQLAVLGNLQVTYPV